MIDLTQNCFCLWKERKYLKINHMFGIKKNMQKYIGKMLKLILWNVMHYYSLQKTNNGFVYFFLLFFSNCVTVTCACLCVLHRCVASLLCCPTIVPNTNTHAYLIPYFDIYKEEEEVYFCMLTVSFRPVGRNRQFC